MSRSLEGRWSLKKRRLAPSAWDASSQSCLPGLDAALGRPRSPGTAGPAAGQARSGSALPLRSAAFLRGAREGEFGDSQQLLSAVSYIV